MAPASFGRHHDPLDANLERPNRDSVDDQKVEEIKFWRGTDLTMRTNDVKTLQAIKRLHYFRNEPYKNFNYLVIGADRDVSMLEAFSDVPLDQITFMQRSKDETERLASHGLKAIKGQPEWHDFGNKGESSSVGGFNVILALDDVRATPHFMQTVASRGFVIGRGPLVAALEETGNYKIIGAVEKDGMAPTMKEGEGGRLEGQVRTDEELKAAGTMKGKVNYDEAVNALDRNGKNVEEIKRKGRVLVEYEKLLGSRPKQHETSAASEDNTTEAANDNKKKTAEKSDEEKLKDVPWRTTDTKLLWVARRIR